MAVESAAAGGGANAPQNENKTAAAKAEPERLPMPSRNPIPLSASQEAQVRDIFYARVRSKCVDEIKGMFFFSLSFFSIPLPLCTKLDQPS